LLALRAALALQTLRSLRPTFARLTALTLQALRAALALQALRA
jgi:hypothetical protein